MPSVDRLLLVCPRCWGEAFPELPSPKQRSVHSIEDCFVCEQARGLIYVKAQISFRPNVPDDPAAATRFRRP